MDRELTTGVATLEDLGRFAMNWFMFHILLADMQRGSDVTTRLTPERSRFEFESHRLWA